VTTAIIKKAELLSTSRGPEGRFCHR